MNIGDKYLQSINSDDISTLSIIKVDDVLEIDRGFDVYECTYLVFKFHGELTNFSNNKN